MLYVDASALIAALGDEEHSDAARRALARGDRLVSSALIEVEVARTMHRAPASVQALARERLDAIGRIAISQEIIGRAARLAPDAGLRSLDAIHVATALAIPDDVGMLTLDRRLWEASLKLGLDVVALR